MKNLKDYKPLFFNNEITPQFVEEFVSKINKNEKYFLYFNSNGGENSSTEFLTTFLNFHYENIIIFTGDFIFSNAFNLLLNFKGEVQIGDTTLGMVHLSSFELNSIDLQNKESSNYISNQDIIEYNKNMIKKYYSFLNKNQLKDLKNGKDIYISNKNLKEIFKFES